MSLSLSKRSVTPWRVRDSLLRSIYEYRASPSSKKKAVRTRIAISRVNFFLLTSDEKSVHYRSFGEAPAKTGAFLKKAQDGENENCSLR